MVTKWLLSGAKQKESNCEKRNILSKTLRKTQKELFFHYFINCGIHKLCQSLWTLTKSIPHKFVKTK